MVDVVKKYTGFYTCSKLVTAGVAAVCFFAAVIFLVQAALPYWEEQIPDSGIHPCTAEDYHFSATVSRSGDIVLPLQRKQKILRYVNLQPGAGFTRPVVREIWDRSFSAFAVTLRPAYYVLLFLYHLF